MDTQERIDSFTRVDTPVTVPQMRVRSDVRSGDDLSTCQSNVAKWQQRYYDAYNKAHAQGCV